MALEKNHFYRFGSFRLDPAKRVLLRSQKPVPLMPKAFDTLLVLVENRDHTVGKDELLKTLWPDSFVEEANLAQNVAVLRKALGDSPKEHRYIVTVPGHGYRFAAKVSEEIEDEDSDLVLERHSRSRVVLEELRTSDIRDQAAPISANRKHLQVWLLASACVVLLLSLVGLASFSARMPHVTSTIRLTWSGRVDEWGSLATDGVRIYYLEREGAHWNLMQTSGQGGSAQPAGATFPGLNAQILDTSRDLSQMLVSTFVSRNTEMPLWTLPNQGGAPHRIGNIETKYAVWTPDGNGILYSHEKDLMLADADGKNARKLLTASGRIYDFSVSPSGKVIRFSTDPHTTEGELWEVSIDGAGLRRLFSNWTKSSGQCCGRWTPDGRYYFFLAWQGSRLGVWAIREHRGFYFWKQPAPVNLISGPNVISRVIPSHDGRQIFALEQNPEDDVMRYDNKLHRLVPVPGLPPNSTVVYSPTGEWILYQNNSDYSLWRSKADGSQPLQLTGPLSRIADPKWSPDATQIVFMGAPAGPSQGTQVYLLTRDGGEPRRLLRDGVWQFHPQWLPDGKSVAISISQVDDAKEPSPGIYVTNVATLQTYKLPESQDIDSATWSPNGRLVAGITQDFHRIRLYDVSKNAWIDCVSGTLIGALSWAPDSESIYYQDVLEEDQPVYRVWLSGTRREKVYDFHEELNSGYFRCVFYAIKSDGSLLVYLSRSNADLYAFDVDFP